eukprot:TRINITY_DN25768_c1_g1_i1.p1 TRINITY_DN25768_c1_g1~~TRINITY_DN25768_c1_g1_i1.p1  ORF type:complete len:346 (+),score=79.72 TRINITY_DN25768_c1_g1_i1:185-1222(+)
MGRPPLQGAPAFRFLPKEIAEMEKVLEEHHGANPPRETFTQLAAKFSSAPERAGNVVVQWKQIWNWFQNRRHAQRSKTTKTASKLACTSSSPGKSSTKGSHASSSATVSGRKEPDNENMDFEARSARDQAWYDVAGFLAFRCLQTDDPEVLVRFAGFGPEEDEWVNVKRSVRRRSLPCEATECVAVLPGDIVLCFQEGKEQALYYDARILDVQRNRHDIRGCRCRFLVRYEHDRTEEIVPLRKVCRRPETDARLLQQQDSRTQLPAPLGEAQECKETSAIHNQENVVNSHCSSVSIVHGDGTLPTRDGKGSDQNMTSSEKGGTHVAVAAVTTEYTDSKTVDTSQQ